MLSLPLPTNIETIYVAMHEDIIDRYVFTIALNCPSSLAKAELYDGYVQKKNYVFFLIIDFKLFVKCLPNIATKTRYQS